MIFRNSTYLLYLILILTTLFSCSSSSRFSSNKYKKEKSKPVNFREGSVFFGDASYYADKFHGRKTANGEIFDMYKKSAAHKSLPFNTILEVTNLDNNKTVIVRVNDRGPFVKGRILDLSYCAAQEINLISQGVCRVKIKILKLGT